MQDRFQQRVPVEEGSSVHRAWDESHGVYRALRILHPDDVPPDGWDALRARLRRAARIRHPYLARWVAAGEQDDRLYLVDEWLPGGTLAELGPIALDLALRWTEGLADALAAAHDGGLVHGRIDDEHILLDDKGRPRLVGLGVGDSEDRQRDLVALGRLLDQLVPVPPPPVEDVIRRAVSGRFDDAGALRDALEGARWGLAAEVGPDVVTLEREDRRRTLGMIAASVLAGALVLVVIFGFWQLTSEPPPELP